MNFDHACSLIGIDGNTPYSTAYGRFRKLAKQTHPDKGGDAAAFQQIKEAWDTVKSVLPKRKPVDMTLRRVTMSKSTDNLFTRLANVSCSAIGETFFGIEYQRIKKGIYKVSEDYGYIIPEEDRILHDGVDCRIEFLTKPCIGWERWKLKRKGE